MKSLRAYYRSPIGTIEVAGTAAGISSLRFVRGRDEDKGPPPEALRSVIGELDEYFRGARREFSTGLALRGTEFQRRVWNELQKIPFGRTASYGRIAQTLGKSRAARAVGRANHLNPVSIIIPCHRVVGQDGGLVGYGGGLWRKRWLLAHEGSLDRGEKRARRSSRKRNLRGGQRGE
jgi:methylated-DNA-[protein]-cysteine S-methyltransferase